MEIDRNRYRQSISNNLNTSIIDKLTNDIQVKLNDPTIGNALVAKALKHLGESQVLSIADYALRKANNPGRAFVKICSNALSNKGI